MKLNEIYLGDCLDIMPNIPDESVDMILADLPLVQQSKMGFSN
jgi:DNA modification methylase